MAATIVTLPQARQGHKSKWRASRRIEDSPVEDESILQEQNERLHEAWPVASTYWFVHSDVLAHVGCRLVDRLACKVQIEFLPQERSQEPAITSPDRRMRHHSVQRVLPSPIPTALH